MYVVFAMSLVCMVVILVDWCCKRCGRSPEQTANVEPGRDDVEIGENTDRVPAQDVSTPSKNCLQKLAFIA